MSQKIAPSPFKIRTSAFEQKSENNGQTLPAMGIVNIDPNETKFVKPKGKPARFGNEKAIGATKEEIEKLQRKLDQLSQKVGIQEEEPDNIEGLTPKQVDLFNEQADKEKLEPIKVMKQEPAFFVIPELDGIPDPLSYTAATPNLVTPASEEYFRILDKMRTVGWPVEGKFGIRYYLKETAKSIKMATGLECMIAKNTASQMSYPKNSFDENQKQIGGETIQNYAEYFCNFYPNAKKHQTLYMEGLKRLKEDIRAQNPNAFLPENYDRLMDGSETTAVCPPKRLDFKFVTKEGTVVTINNILRHFTEWDKNAPLKRQDTFGGDSETYECSPPAGMANSWIPTESMLNTEFLAKYNLQMFKYMGSAEFQRILYNITRPIDISHIDVASIPTSVIPQGQTASDFAANYADEMKNNYLDDAAASIMRDLDFVNGESEPHPFITINDQEAKKAWKIFVAELEINYPPSCEDEDDPAILMKGHSMREWCFLLDPENPENLISRFYPFLYVVYNSLPPDPKHFPFEKVSPYIWQVDVGSDKKESRMYSKAPIGAFQASLIKKYGKDFDQIDSHTDCLEKFMKNMWQDCVSCNVYSFKDNEIDEIPQDYRDLMKRIFEYGGNTGCSIREIKAKAKENTTESINNPKNDKFDIKKLITDDFDDLSKISLLKIGEKFDSFINSRVSSDVSNKKSGSMI